MWHRYRCLDCTSAQASAFTISVHRFMQRAPTCRDRLIDYRSSFPAMKARKVAATTMAAPCGRSEPRRLVAHDPLAVVARLMFAPAPGSCRGGSPATQRGRRASAGAPERAEHDGLAMLPRGKDLRLPRTGSQPGEVSSPVFREGRPKTADRIRLIGFPVCVYRELNTEDGREEP